MGIEAEKGIVFLGSGSRLSLKAVTKMSHVASERPFLNRLSHGICDVPIELFPHVDCLHEFRVDLFGEMLLHLVKIKCVDPVEFRNSKRVSLLITGGIKLARRAPAHFSN